MNFLFLALAVKLRYRDLAKTGLQQAYAQEEEEEVSPTSRGKRSPPAFSVQLSASFALPVSSFNCFASKLSLSLSALTSASWALAGPRNHFKTISLM